MRDLYATSEPHTVPPRDSLWFGRSRIRLYELSYVIVASLAANLLASHIGEGMLTYSVGADVLLLVAAICIFSVYAKLSAIWEQHLREKDPIAFYNLDLTAARQRQLRIRVALAVAALVAAVFVIALNSPGTKAPQPSAPAATNSDYDNGE